MTTADQSPKHHHRGAGHQILQTCVGQRRERERPVVLGLYNQALRDKVLKANYGENIAIGPDMTKKQREEEAEIWLELDQKNKNRTAEQVAKNLMWRLVGPKGDRRLILGPARQQGAGAAPGRGPSSQPERPANIGERDRPLVNNVQAQAGQQEEGQGGGGG
jgi:hypothetical protein